MQCAHIDTIFETYVDPIGSLEDDQGHGVGDEGSCDGHMGDGGPAIRDITSGRGSEWFMTCLFMITLLWCIDTYYIWLNICIH